jgi:hypothetical protein
MVLKIRRALMGAGVVCALALIAAPASADKIKHPTAVFDGLDKITGRIISFEVAIDETVQFGSLQITPRVCYNRPPTEAPRTDAFAEVDEVETDKKYTRIFSGWMFAASPGLHGIEHPVYDIWLVDCKGGTEIIHTAPDQTADLPDADNPPDAAAATDPNGTKLPPKKRKVKAPDANAPLDINGQPIEARAPPTQRFFPTTDGGPIPPANIPKGR